MDDKKSTRKPSFFDGIIRIMKREARRRRTERGALLADIAVFLMALFFARRHVMFGAYPLASALVATLPSRVWIALAGALFGAFSLGRVGIIHAIISVVIVFLRIIISGSTRREEGADERLFAEPYIMRVASAAIGAFIGAIYELLLEGFSLSAILFGCFGVLLTVLLAFSYFGVFTSDITPASVVFGGRKIFDSASERERTALWLFQGSFLVLVLLLSVSLIGYDFFGISLSYIFSAAITLFVARRFGAVRGMVCGFVAAVGISPVGAVGFALVGLLSGMLFSFGLGYALFGGAAVLCAWCAYSDGLSGFLSVFPEYGIAAMLMTPYLRGAVREDERTPVTEGKSAADTVTIAARGYRERMEHTSRMEESLILAADSIRAFGMGAERGDFDEYRNIVIAATSALTPTPCEEKIDVLSTRLYKKGFVDRDDIVNILETDSGADELLASISSSVGEYDAERYELGRTNSLASEYELISKMMNLSASEREREGAVDTSLSERLTEELVTAGFPDGCVKVMGERRRHIIAAADDEDGSRISASELRERLSRAVGAPLTAPEFYRRDNISILECSCAPIYRVEYATSSKASSRTGISGDSTAFFEHDEAFFALLSDGMGSGLVAQRTSRFAVDYLSHTVVRSHGAPVALSALNNIVRYHGEECSVTVDLFSLDLLTGEACFTKCGAAPSYVKRADSIFRIRSHTAPVGLMRAVDSEQVRVEIGCGDYVVMMSDGIAAMPEEVPWLFEFLTSPTDVTAAEYADKILELASRFSDTTDDITVSVVHVLPV